MDTIKNVSAGRKENNDQYNIPRLDMKGYATYRRFFFNHLDDKNFTRSSRVRADSLLIINL